MINFYLMDLTQIANDDIDTKANKAIFEKISISHIKFYKILTISIYYNLLRFFKVINKDVYISYITKENEIVSYAVCYPKSFKYPFMESNDYQIGSVYTDVKHRKKGYSELVIQKIIQNINCSRIWYLTESDNIPSINLCKKMNFKYFNNGRRSNDKLLSFMSIYEISEEN